MLLGACCWAAGLVAPLPSQHISGQYHLSHAAGGSHLAVRSRLVLAVANDLPEIPLGGAELNEEVRLSVQYLGGPASRQRRVRRTKRQSREERWRQSSLAYREGHSRMSAFCSFDTLDLEGAVELFEQDARWRRLGDSVSIVSYTDVVHCHFSTRAGAERHVFLFPYGSVLLWGCTEEQEHLIMEALVSCSEPLSESAIFPISGALRLNGDVAVGDEETLSDQVDDSEFMLFRYDTPEASDPAADTDAAETPPPLRMAKIESNVIVLKTNDPVEKVAISFAFAQSSKLSVLEAALDVTIAEVRALPEQLALTGSPNLSVKKIAKLTGRIFLQRNEANLHSNILDCPDFFWEAEEYEKLYRRVHRYLDVEDRTSVLNKRLDIVNDLLDSISSQLEVRTAHRLEIIIIALIMIEIALEVFKGVPIARLLRWPVRALGALVFKVSA